MHPAQDAINTGSTPALGQSERARHCGRLAPPHATGASADEESGHCGARTDITPIHAEGTTA